MVGLSFVTGLVAMWRLGALAPGSALVDHLYRWMAVGNLHVNVDLAVDALSAAPASPALISSAQSAATIRRFLIPSST